MIKVETLGMIENAKNVATLTSQNVVSNYQFITDNGVLYLIDNVVTGDDAYKEGITFAAGTKLRGFEVKAWENQKLVVDEKHIAYDTGETYASSITAGTTLLGVDNDGKLEIISSVPASGVYFKVTEKVTLTEKAVKVRVMVAPVTLASLSDVDFTTAPTNGQVLGYNGTKWAATADKTE